MNNNFNNESKEIKKSLTIKEIANLAGVSTATISRVLNQPERVSKKLRDNVEAVIQKYNYVPNQLAKNFTTNNSRSIALFVYDIENPFFTKLIEGLNRIAFDMNYNLVICDTGNDKDREIRYLNYLKGIRVSGIILTEGNSQDTVYNIANTVPCVIIDRECNTNINCPVITSNNYEGAAMAMEHLIKLNHKKIAFIGGPVNISTVKERQKGYIDTMKKYGLEIPNGFINNVDLNVMGGVRALEHCVSLNQVPTAIFCANDLIAQGIILRSYSMNISIPKDFSVIGFDGLIADTFYPKITTLQQQMDKIVKHTMKELLNMINGEDYNKKIVVPTKLIIGETCMKKE